MGIAAAAVTSARAIAIMFSENCISKFHRVAEDQQDWMVTDRSILTE